MTIIEVLNKFEATYGPDALLSDNSVRTMTIGEWQDVYAMYDDELDNSVEYTTIDGDAFMVGEDGYLDSVAVFKVIQPDDQDV